MPEGSCSPSGSSITALAEHGLGHSGVGWQVAIRPLTLPTGHPQPERTNQKRWDAPDGGCFPPDHIGHDPAALLPGGLLDPAEARLVVDRATQQTAAASAAGAAARSPGMRPRRRRGARGSSAVLRSRPARAPRAPRPGPGRCFRGLSGPRSGRCRDPRPSRASRLGTRPCLCPHALPFVRRIAAVGVQRPSESTRQGGSC